MLLHYNGEHRQLFNYVLLLSTNTIIINFSTFSRLKHFNLLMKDNYDSVILIHCIMYIVKNFRNRVMYDYIAKNQYSDFTRFNFEDERSPYDNYF